jgi:hypothetical protein
MGKKVGSHKREGRPLDESLLPIPPFRSYILKHQNHPPQKIFSTHGHHKKYSRGKISWKWL